MTYEYECRGCQHAWTAEQRITEDAVKTCPACGTDQAVRLISGGAFRLVGAGWSADNYSRSSQVKPGKKFR